MGLAVEKFYEELRKSVRRRVLKTGKIAFRNHFGAIDCTIRNLSEGGACIKVESPFGIPDSFDLIFEGGAVRRCRVAWRKVTQIGVEFIQM